MGKLRPENRALFKIPKPSKIKHQERLFDGSLAESRPEQHKHSIVTRKLNTANMLSPVVTSTTAKEMTSTDTYSLNGISLSEDQFYELTK